jgi:hypothetical protein
VTRPAGARRDLGPWPLRIVWLSLPLVAGPAVGALLDGRSRPVGWIAGALAALGWAGGLVATLVPHPLGLTALRVLGPAALALSGLALVGGDAAAAAGVAALAVAAVACVTIASGTTTDAFVDGASYGAERRFGLRVPASLLLGPLPLTWAVVVVGAVAGPLALAAGLWVLGVVLIGIGWPLAAGGLRALHGLSLRCVVFVPGGLVLADRTVVAQPVLFPRRAVAHVGAAETGTDAVDLTAGALGLVLEVRLVEPIGATRRQGRHGAEEVTLHAFLLSPVRPGALLDAARGHRLSVT